MRPLGGCVSARRTAGGISEVATTGLRAGCCVRLALRRVAGLDGSIISRAITDASIVFERFIDSWRDIRVAWPGIRYSPSKSS